MAKAAAVHSLWKHWFQTIAKSAPLQLKGSGGGSSSYYLTTALNYTNGQPHMGHAYEVVVGDVLARYHRLAGKVFLLYWCQPQGTGSCRITPDQGNRPASAPTCQFCAAMAPWAPSSFHNTAFGWRTAAVRQRTNHSIDHQLPSVSFQMPTANRC